MSSRNYEVSLQYGADEALTANTVALLAAVTTANTVNEVLDIVRNQIIARRAVTANTIGKDTSSLN